MDGLPEALEELGLFIPKGFLLYALGYRDELRNEGFSKEAWSDADIENFMKMAFEQPGRLQMPDCPQIDDGATVAYMTNILGCEIRVEALAAAYPISIAESVLSALESFFATSLDQRVAPYRQTATVILQPSTKIVRGLKVSIENVGGADVVRVVYPDKPPAMDPEGRGATRDGLMSVIIYLIGFIAIIEDAEAYFDKMGGEERAFARALIYSESSLAQENVFGGTPKVLISDWQPAEAARRFPLVRTKIWYDGITLNQIPLPEDEAMPISGEEVAPHSTKDFLKRYGSKGKHSDRKIASFIDIPLWNKAAWKGVFFGKDPRLAKVPILGLAFKNIGEGAKIFEGWRRILGEHDKDDRLRVTILTGADKENAAWYKVYITSNVSVEEMKSGSTVVSVGRIHLMSPNTSENLDRFLETMKSSSQFLLVPAHLSDDMQVEQIGVGLGILKQKLVVRPAWEVGPQDLDSPAFKPDDDPIIPDGVDDAPILRLLEFIREADRRKV
jgi:hypothetical protein